ncbi:MAG: TolC family protein [Muribaculaceae bacterium]|nr:TolC family protein [Muribaculaceae bacterium]
MKQQLVTATLLAALTLSAAAETWSYADCVDYALANNISLRKSRLNQETAAYNLEEARAQWEPTLDFATTQGFANYPWGDGSKNSYSSSYGFNAGWTVWNGGSRENTIKRRKIDAEISTVQTDDAERTMRTDLLQVYLNILYARESVGVYEEAARVSGAQAERGRQLMEAGRASRVDYAQLRSTYEQDCYALVNARSTYETRRMELKELLELGIDTDVELRNVEWTEAQVLAALPALDGSYALALDNDLPLRTLALEAEGTDIDVAIAKASGRPSVSLSAGVGTGYNAPGISFGRGIKQNFGENVGVTLSVPILNRKQSKTATSRAQVQKMEAQLDIDRRTTELGRLVENWYIDTRSAQSRYTAARQQVEAAELTEQLTSEQFALGLVNPIDLMTAHRDHVEAQHSMLQAKYMAILGQKMIEYYRTATVAL